ncbi:MAG: response regulator [Nitrospirota bacterium]|nr:response regulator [Nitrospirota bacterium]
MSRILVIDDCEDVRHCLEYALESYGYEVVSCGTACEAMEHIRKEPFGFVITDFEMPDTDGITLTQAIRAVMPRTIIIGISGIDCSEDFLRAGANDFRQKPFVPYEIAMMIDGADMTDPEPMQ